MLARGLLRVTPAQDGIWGSINSHHQLPGGSGGAAAMALQAKCSGAHIQDHKQTSTAFLASTTSPTPTASPASRALSACCRALSGKSAICLCSLRGRWRLKAHCGDFERVDGDVCRCGGVIVVAGRLKRFFAINIITLWYCNNELQTLICITSLSRCIIRPNLAPAYCRIKLHGFFTEPP